MAKNIKKSSNKLFHKATQLHQRGNVAGAREIFLQLVENDPDNPEILHNLGITEYQFGNIPQAIELISNAIKLNPKDANYYSNLAMCYGDMENFEESDRHYRTALSKNPRLTPALIGLGSLLAKQGLYKEAEKYLADVVKKHPGHVIANVNYALTLQNMNLHSQALIYAKKGVKIDPSNADAQNNLGSIYLDLGEFSLAHTCFREALRLNPGCGKAFLNLARSKKFVENDEDQKLIEQSEQILKQNIRTSTKASFHFGLGKIYDDLKLWDKAFQHIRQANSLVPVEYSEKELELNLESIAGEFSLEWLSGHEEIGNKDVKPIFVVGMPRSGTTLIAQIISSHSNVYNIGESHAIPELANLTESLVENGKPYPHCIDQLDTTTVSKLVDKYMDAAKQNDSYDSEKRPLDKMTTNYMHLGFIMTMFPNAKIIHCVRNKLDVCLSCYFQDFAARPAFAYDLGSINHFYNEYERIVQHWKLLFSDNIFDVEYDDIVNNTEDSTRKMLEFCELEWEDNCLHYYKSKQKISTASNWQAKQPIYKQSLARWKNYEKYLGPLKKSESNNQSDTNTGKIAKQTTRSRDNNSLFRKIISKFSS